ncbi:ABC transporter ATP-binding protein [Cereibacter sphaeroides]|uniref:ABC transporter ATP-binding protein n=1 Tax=Cereibacter sphaeroides TaxID=1063 RepID=UPI001F45113D|nr:ABC transporter ATP-binding protein [Cereibacter sphaeroides]MCE6961700.1 ABC transporter ATP-binding protein [Cereibacter sphaeroides]MCE6975050.1 ABC transporter ATP-binding protein [Cereibacter sphaeroides]
MPCARRPCVTDAPPPVLEIEELTVTFTGRRGSFPAVEAFSCRIMPGETLGLVGESGSGKSTVALAVMRDLGPAGRITGGAIRVMERDITTLPERDLRRIRGSQVAMVGQEPMAALNPAMRIGAQLAEVPRIHRRASAARAMDQVRRAVEEVGLPDPARILRSYPHQLSGGQLQRVAIAMALMARPALLILDEPTTALDVTVEAGIVELLQAIARRRGTSMLFVSHNLGLVAGICDRVAVLYAGQVVETGTVGRIFGAPRHPYTRALLRAVPRLDTADRQAPLSLPGEQPLPHERPAGCAFAPRCPHAVPGRCDQLPVPLTVLGGPQDAARCLRLDEIPGAPDDARPTLPAASGPGQPLLTVEGLTKHFRLGRRRLRAVTDVSFEALEGETLAIVGESGCGKSTLARLLMGLEHASAGRILLQGREVQDLPAGRRPADLVAAMQMVFQNPSDTLNPSMTVGRQILRALTLFRVAPTRAGRHARLLGLLERVRLPPALAAFRPGRLSGGQRQRVAIARALAGDARLLVADEPVSALDASVQAAVVGLLLDIQRDRGGTLLFISHDLALVRQIADRVMVMYLGQVMEIGPAARVFGGMVHPYTEALVSAVPVPDPVARRDRIVLAGDPPSALEPPPGCPFQTRCHRRTEVPGGLCATLPPPLAEVAPGHRIRCHLPPDRLARRNAAAPEATHGAVEP